MKAEREGLGGQEKHREEGRTLVVVFFVAVSIYIYVWFEFFGRILCVFYFFVGVYVFFSKCFGSQLCC